MSSMTLRCRNAAARLFTFEALPMYTRWATELKHRYFWILPSMITGMAYTFLHYGYKGWNTVGNQRDEWILYCVWTTIGKHELAISRGQISQSMFYKSLTQSSLLGTTTSTLRRVLHHQASSNWTTTLPTPDVAVHICLGLVLIGQGIHSRLRRGDIGEALLLRSDLMLNTHLFLAAFIVIYCAEHSWIAAFLGVIVSFAALLAISAYKWWWENQLILPDWDQAFVKFGKEV
ncbi:hypothetical protein BU16DRAFT_561950 [Lophium mytilinum]|uniref:Uncharacterized protein n=1 Tax=Lophium mytilinum TaxID=390894 RepID=A0A6A6QTE1_9PEZI|nr:hypothetical protein BU16DRAFT_561950 [Lophium mytilinum]